MVSSLSDQQTLMYNEGALTYSRAGYKVSEDNEDIW